MANQVINKDQPLLLNRTANFFGISVDKYNIYDPYFDVADAIAALISGLSRQNMGDVGDDLTPAQVEEIDKQYNKFVGKISKMVGGGDEVKGLKKELQSSKMQIGKLKAKIKKLEA